MNQSQDKRVEVWRNGGEEEGWTADKMELDRRAGGGAGGAAGLSAGIYKQSIGARNRVGIGLSYQPARLHSLAELVPWNRFLGSLKV